MVELPLEVQRLMWEYELDSLNQGPEIPDAIIERVMARGGWSEMQWLLRTLDCERLRNFLQERGRQVLAPREISFWALACGIPEKTATTWRKESVRRERAWRG